MEFANVDIHLLLHMLLFLLLLCFEHQAAAVATVKTGLYTEIGLTCMRTAICVPVSSLCS